MALRSIYCPIQLSGVQICNSNNHWNLNWNFKINMQHIDLTYLLFTQICSSSFLTLHLSIQGTPFTHMTELCYTPPSAPSYPNCQGLSVPHHHSHKILLKVLFSVIILSVLASHLLFNTAWSDFCTKTILGKVTNSVVPFSRPYLSSFPPLQEALGALFQMFACT